MTISVRRPLGSTLKSNSAKRLAAVVAVGTVCSSLTRLLLSDSSGADGAGRLRRAVSSIEACFMRESCFASASLTRA